MREIGFTSKVFTPDSIVGQLSGGERQGVALARAIYNKADLIVMDEPTTALSLTETEKVFRFVRTVPARHPHQGDCASAIAASRSASEAYSAIAFSTVANRRSFATCGVTAIWWYS
jgi:ABC-type transport system involved in cytochrome c biogenesis ATPase subunit